MGANGKRLDVRNVRKTTTLKFDARRGFNRKDKIKIGPHLQITQWFYDNHREIIGFSERKTGLFCCFFQH